MDEKSQERKAQARELGAAGERLAAAFLERRGMRVLERGWRTGHLEIDLLMCDAEGVLRVVEVKSRRVNEGECPSDFAAERAMTPTKAQRVLRAAEQYARCADHQGEIALDLVAVDFTASAPGIRYYPNIQW